MQEVDVVNLHLVRQSISLHHLKMKVEEPADPVAESKFEVRECFFVKPCVELSLDLAEASAFRLGAMAIFSNMVRFE